MLELSKKILKGVSFDQKLFIKELKKSIIWMTNAEELKKFEKWCYNNFNHLYKTDIELAFNTTKC